MTWQAEDIRRMLAYKDAHDLDGFFALCAPDVVMVSAGQRLAGRDAVRAFFENEAAAFPYQKTEFTTIITGGDVVAFEVVVETTNEGPMETPMGTLPATGRTVTIPYAGFVKVEAGLASSIHIHYDQLAFMIGLGLMPQPALA